MKSNKISRFLSLLLCMVLVCSNGAVQIAAAEPGTAGEAQVIGLSEEGKIGNTAPVITVKPVDPNHVTERSGNVLYYCEAPEVVVEDDDLKSVNVKFYDYLGYSDIPQEVKDGKCIVDFNGQRGNMQITASDGENSVTENVMIDHGIAEYSTYTYLYNAPANCAQEESRVFTCGYCKVCGEYAMHEMRRPYGNNKPEHKFEEKETITVEEMKACGETVEQPITKNICADCGYVKMTTADGEEYKLPSDWNSKNHKWVRIKNEEKLTCKQGVYRYYECSECGVVRNMSLREPRVHSFGPYVETEKPDCHTGKTGKKTATCEICHTQVTMDISGNHKYVDKIIQEPTCTAAGKKERVCEYCNEKEPNSSRTLPALGHNYVASEDDCTAGRKCTRCQSTQPGNKTHTYEWVSDADGHYQVCTVEGCLYQENKTEHTFSGTANDCTNIRKCTQCGYVEKEAFDQHSYGPWQLTEEDGIAFHFRKCTNPGCDIVDKGPHVLDEAARHDCTLELKCSVCETVVREAKTAHDLRYGHTISGHYQECVTDGCDYRTETKEHDINYDNKDCTKDIKCNECGYVAFHRNWQHTFTNSAYHDGGETGHYQICRNNKCEVHSTPVPHSGGEATCKDKAICEVCHASYGELSKTNHTGGTKMERQKDATETEDGYTGDEVCLGCGAVIKEGTVIPKLKKPCDHVGKLVQEFDDTQSWYRCTECEHTQDYVPHNLSEYKTNENGHWKQCTTCKYVTTESVHVLNEEEVDRNCTTAVHCKECGYTMIQAEEKHNFDTEYAIGDTEHWHVCTNPDCEAISQKTPHDPVDDGDCTTPVVCKDCGHVLGGDEKAHCYPSTWQIDGDEHYRKCENPGCKQEQRAPHDKVLDDNNCTTPVVCLTCQHIIKEAEPFHNFGGSYSTTETGHYQHCQNPDCKEISGESAHSGGIATCISPAFCQICGISYGPIDPDNHMGRQELHDYKAPTVEEEGYSGNVVCLDCNKVVAYGRVLDRLPAEFEHTFNIRGSDDTHHWKECACGTIDETSYKEHSFGEWESDVTSHWHLCAECGKQVMGEHVMKDGMCTVCGYKAEHVHTYEWKYDDFNHEQVCSGCNETVNNAPHTFENGYCTACGAQEHRIGDPDRDGRISVLDALTILRCVVGTVELDDNMAILADVDHNGDVDVNDALLVIKYVAGVIREFPDNAL